MGSRRGYSAGFTERRGSHSRPPASRDALGLEPDAPDGFTDRMSAGPGPRWLGGEHLPPFERGEVEIVRVVLASTTRDVFRIRARRTPLLPSSR